MGCRVCCNCPCHLTAERQQQRLDDMMVNRQRMLDLPRHMAQYATVTHHEPKSILRQALDDLQRFFRF